MATVPTELDLVKKLRLIESGAVGLGIDWWQKTSAEAAMEIERLRAGVNKTEQREHIDRLEIALCRIASRFDDLAIIIERDGSYQNAGFMKASANRCRGVLSGKSFDTDN